MLFIDSLKNIFFWLYDNTFRFFNSIYRVGGHKLVGVLCILMQLDMRIHLIIKRVKRSKFTFYMNIWCGYPSVLWKCPMCKSVLSMITLIKLSILLSLNSEMDFGSDRLIFSKSYTPVNPYTEIGVEKSDNHFGHGIM